MGPSKRREPSTNNSRVLLVLSSSTHNLVPRDIPLHSEEEGAEAGIRHA